VRRGGFAVGALAALQLTHAGRALAAPAVAGPKPIPGGFSASFKPVPANAAAHVLRPLKGGELNTIGDFNGFVAAAEIQGMAKGSDGSTYGFDCDMRFMQGAYIGTDSRLARGTRSWPISSTNRQRTRRGVMRSRRRRRH
jgi:hypothetical protein